MLLNFNKEINKVINFNIRLSHNKLENQLMFEFKAKLYNHKVTLIQVCLFKIIFLSEKLPIISRYIHILFSFPFVLILLLLS